MLGLIKKDLLVARRYSRMLLVVAVLYFILSLSGSFVGVLGLLGMLASMMVTLSAFAYDDQAKWDSYVSALPVKRSTVVQARYMLAMGIILVGMVLSAVLTAVICLVRHTEVLEAIPSVLGSAAGGVAIMAVYLPLLYKFGTEKSRFLFIFFFAFIGAGGYLLSKSNLKLPAMTLSGPLFILILVLALLLLLYVSYVISARIYTKKEW